MTRWTRRLLAAVAAVVAGGLLAAPAGGSGVTVAVFEGRGFGHGVGMAQDGAYWMGAEGASLAEILGHFYPGTSIAEAGGNVVVVVHSAGAGGVWISFPAGGEVRAPLMGPQHAGFPVTVAPGGAVLVRHADGRHHVEGGAAAAAAAGAPSATASGPDAAGPASFATAQVPTAPIDPLPTTTTTEPDSTTTTTSPLPVQPGPDEPPPDEGQPPQPPPDAPGGPAAGSPSSPEPVWAVTAEDHTLYLPERERRYRGVIEATGAGGELRLRNHVDVEQYLRGMGEVLDPRWPQASLQAQAVAARTYALRAMAVSGEICDVQRCQVYVGQQAEYRAMDEAVAATRGQVLIHGGRLISAVYSANGGGVSASTEEGFGTAGSSHPYLRPAPYLTRDPSPWSVAISLADLARRLGYRGTIDDVVVADSGPSGRPTEVELRGDAGAVRVPALALRASLGLRSTLWELRLDVVDEAPPPPEPDASFGVQALPEELTLAELGAAGGPPADPPARADRSDAAVAAPPPGRSDPSGALLAALLLALAVAGVIGAAGLRAEARRP